MLNFFKTERIIFLIAIGFASVSSPVSVSSVKRNSDALYDIYKDCLSHLQKEYELDYDSKLLQKGDNKRSTNKKLIIRSGNLYDEFKKRLDRFNDALNIDIDYENSHGKRSSSLNSDIPHILVKESYNPINRDNRGIFSFLNKKITGNKNELNQKQNVLEFNNTKETRPSHNLIRNQSFQIPDSMYDKSKKQLEGWTGSLICNNRKQRSQHNANIVPYFVWQKENNQNDFLEKYELQNFIKQCRTEGYKGQVKRRHLKNNHNYQNYNTNNNNNNGKANTFYEAKIPFDISTMSLYPLVYEMNGNVITIRPESKQLLHTYATAPKLVRRLIEMNSNINDNKFKTAQSEAPTIQMNSNNLDADSSYVFKDFSKISKEPRRRMIYLPLLRNHTLLVNDAVQRN